MANFEWIKALNQWREKGMGDNGCTLPFLIGIQTQKNPPASCSVTDIHEILNYASSNEIEKFWLRLCPKLRYPVLQKINAGQADDEYGKWFGNLLVEDKLYTWGADLNDIIKQMIDENASKLASHEYSFNSGIWGDYSEKEKSFIKSIL